MGPEVLGEIAAHPLALSGFGLWLLVGLLKALLKNRIIPKLSQKQGAKITSWILRIVFVFGLLLIALAFYVVYSDRVHPMDEASVLELATQIVKAIEREHGLFISQEHAEETVLNVMQLLSKIEDSSHIEVTMDSLLEGDISVAERLLSLQFEHEYAEGQPHFSRAAEYAYGLGTLKQLSSLPDAIPYFRRAHTLNPLENRFTTSLANSLWSAGRIEEAVVYFEELAKEWIDTENEWQRIRGYLLMSGLSLQFLNCDQAKEQLCMAGEALSRLGKENGEDNFLFDPETCEMEFNGLEQRNPDLVSEYRAQVEFARGSGNHLSVARNLSLLGEQLRGRGNTGDAIRALMMARDICVENSFLSLLHKILYELGISYVQFEELDPSLRYKSAMNSIRAGIHVAKTQGNELSVIYGQALAGWASLSFGQKQQGLLLYRRAYQEALDLGLNSFAAQLALVSVDHESSDRELFDFAQPEDFQCRQITSVDAHHD